MTYAKIIHSKSVDQHPWHTIQGACRVELAAESDNIGPHIAVTIRVGKSFHLTSKYNPEVNIACLHSLFKHTTHTVRWRKTMPTGFELGTINEDNNQFTMKLRLDQSFFLFRNILSELFKTALVYQAYIKLSMNCGRQLTYTGQKFNWHEAMHDASDKESEMLSKAWRSLLNKR